MNDFYEVTTDTFLNSFALDLISLANQGDLILHEYAFRGVPSEAEIALGGCHIGEIQRGVFAGRHDALVDLHALDLTTLRSYAFENTSNLQIRLTGNYLTSIAPNSFPYGTIHGSTCDDYACMFFFFMTLHDNDNNKPITLQAGTRTVESWRQRRHVTRERVQTKSLPHHMLCPNSNSSSGRLLCVRRWFHEWNEFGNDQIISDSM